MSTNGHSNMPLPPALSAEEINEIMDEWGEITYWVKEELRGSILTDSHFHEERELDIILTLIIPAAFAFGHGAEPNSIEDPHCMWDYPIFAHKIRERAKKHGKEGTSTRDFIKFVFSPKFTDRPNDEPIAALKRLLLQRNGRGIILKRLLGEDELLRIEGIFKEGIHRVSKRRRPDSSDDPEELKSIPAFTSTHA